jgi:uncharacterized membrane protein YjjP (DUF1212 family)
VKLLKLLHTSGSSTHRTEVLALAAATGMGIFASISVFPTYIIVTFHASIDQIHNKVSLAAPLLDSPTQEVLMPETFHFALEQGFNGAKLQDVIDLAVMTSQKSISISRLNERLDELTVEKPLYSNWLQVVCFAVSSGCSPLLFYGGAWIDGLAAFIIGAIVGILSIQFGRIKRFLRVAEMFISIFVGFATYSASTFVPDFCPFAVSLSAIIWLLPGLSITTAVSELAAHSLVSGTSRFFGAIITALQVGFGLAIGSNLVIWRNKSVEDDIVKGCPLRVSLWYSPLFLLAVATSFNVLLNCRPTQFAASTVTAIGGWLVFFLVSSESFGLLDSDSSVAVSAFAIGVIGQIIALITNHSPTTTIVCGIIMLVPGGLAVRGAASMFTSRGVSAIDFGVSMITTSFSITMGLIVAKAMIPSTRKSQRGVIINITDDVTLV